jgi:uncharacterized membrane protein YidH (DUF202 family)
MEEGPDTNPPTSNPEIPPMIYLITIQSSEQNYLVWVRLSFTLYTFGFVLEKLLRDPETGERLVYSTFLAVLLIGTGLLLQIWAYVVYKRSIYLNTYPWVADWTFTPLLLTFLALLFSINPSISATPQARSALALIGLDVI